MKDANRKAMFAKNKKLKDNIPDDYDWKTHGSHPQQFTDEAYNKHSKKHRAIAEKLNDEINNETHAMIENVENLKGYHEDAVRDADKIIKELQNKNHEGNSLPLEYMDLDSTEIHNFVRDWSNVTTDNYGSLERGGEQNSAIVSHLKKLKEYQEKLNKYHHSHGMNS